MNHPIRLHQRAVDDPAVIDRFLTEARIGCLGLSADDQPYVVPLNFVWLNDAVYFHGAAEGRKAAYMRQNSRVCFTVSAEYGTIAAPVPAHVDTAYMSVIMFGEAAAVTDLEEATAAMQGMLDKFVPGLFDQPLAKTHLDKYRSSLGSKTAVTKINVTELTAKRNAPVEGRMFDPSESRRL